MATTSATAELKKGDKVTVVEPMPGVPEGTTGKVHLVNGIGTWTRVWVRFDNGEWMGSISTNKLVRTKELDAYRQRKDEEAKAAAEAASRPAAAPVAAAAPAADGDGASAGGAASKVPAHLLERSKLARERKAAAAAGGE